MSHRDKTQRRARRWGAVPAAAPGRRRTGGRPSPRRPSAGARLRAAVLGTVTAVLLSGCGGGFGGVEDLPLPGGADLGGNPYEVTAEFANVLDLVPHASVKVNDVAVGRVKDVTLPENGWRARVTMLVNGKVKLPANATARLEQSSLLGEKYVQLAAPDSGATGRLKDGAVIPVARTNRNVEVEEVFGALSMLLNGGGLPQLRTITREMNKALVGNEAEIKSVLQRINKFTSSLNSNRGDIVAALDGLNQLSGTLAGRKGKLDTILTDLSPGLKVFEEQRGMLMTMLRQFEKLSDVAVNTINASKDDMVADLKALAPTLRELADAGENLPKSLQVLFTYPFTDQVMNAIKGDYLNVYLSVTAIPGTTIIPPLDPDGDDGDGDTTSQKADKARGKPTLPLPPADSPEVVQPPVVPGTPRSPSPGRTTPSTTPDDDGGVLPTLPGGSPAPSTSGNGGQG